MGLDYNRLVVAYHGTDEEVVRRALVEGIALKPSENDYDWLGSGIYFWEQGPIRALNFADEMRILGKGHIEIPAVLGAYINLGDCLDLLDIESTKLISEFYRLYHRKFKKLSNTKRREDGTMLFHRLDCAVINSLVEFLEVVEKRKIDTVRGCFLEGGPVYPRAQIMRKSHIQIAVRNPKCVLGYFRPRIDKG